MIQVLQNSIIPVLLHSKRMWKPRALCSHSTWSSMVDGKATFDVQTMTPACLLLILKINGPSFFSKEINKYCHMLFFIKHRYLILVHKRVLKIMNNVVNFQDEAQKSCNISKVIQTSHRCIAMHLHQASTVTLWFPFLHIFLYSPVL